MKYDGSDTASRVSAQRFDRSPGGLECLRCRHVFGVDDLGAIREAVGATTYIECTWCSARNEVRAVPQPGLGTPPHAVIVRVLRGAR